MSVCDLKTTVFFHVHIDIYTILKHIHQFNFFCLSVLLFILANLLSKNLAFNKNLVVALYKL